MTIPLTGSGGLYTRLGHLFGGLADANALRGGVATARVLSGANLASRINTIQGDFAAGTGLQQAVDGIYSSLSGTQSGLSSLFTDFASRAQSTLKAMYSIDQGVSPNAPLATLTASDLTTALKTLIAQMNTAAASVNASVPTAGAQTAVGTPNGNPVIVTSLKDSLGRTLQYVFPEVLTFACSADSQGSATLGNEPVRVGGQPAVSDVWSQLWPGGSGVSASLSAVDGSKSNSAGNLLTNGDFTAWTTANYPDNWVISVGTAGTTVFNGSSAGAYTTGGGALQLTGDAGGTLSALLQPFNTATSTAAGAGGTPGKVLADGQYAFNLWLKVSATPAAGVLELALVDGSGTVINDDQGAANLATKSLTAVSTSYVNFNGTFRLPAVLPSAVKLRLRLSTAIDNGKSVYVGRLALAAMSQLYAGGPFASVFSGNTKLIAGASPDTWTVAVGNTYGAFQQYFERAFSMRSLGLQLPASGSPTIADSLIA